MTLDELRAAIAGASPDPVVQGLAKVLERWKAGDRDVEQLVDDVERYVGNTWVQSDDDHRAMYDLWKRFRDEQVRSVGGMTMNERLHAFSLFPEFDSANTRAEQDRLYTKLLAKR